jgi:hypothetical protein
MSGTPTRSSSTPASTNDGTVNLLVNPQAFTMYFYSPSTTSMVTVVSGAPVGTFYSTNPPTTNSPTAIFLPIPPKALDLTDAVAAERQAGFNGGMEQAELNYYQENGKPIRLVWALFTGEAYPRVVSAASGAVLSPFVAFDDKVADYNKLAADTQAALARMKATGRPGARSAWAAEGLLFWAGNSEGGGSQPESPAGSSGDEDQSYENTVGAQNAFDDGNPDAQARFDAGTPTEVDQDNYSN